TQGHVRSGQEHGLAAPQQPRWHLGTAPHSIREVRPHVGAGGVPGYLHRRLIASWGQGLNTMSTKKRSSKPEKVAGRSVGTEPSTATTASGPSAALRPRGSGFVSRPLYHDSLCRVCSHPERGAIEDQIAAGLSASKVAELVKEYDAPCPSVRSIRKHRAS